jgi:hypothetical protein
MARQSRSNKRRPHGVRIRRADATAARRAAPSSAHHHPVAKSLAARRASVGQGRTRRCSIKADVTFGTTKARRKIRTTRPTTDMRKGYVRAEITRSRSFFWRS